MIKLTGRNLNERHKELNKIVIEAERSNVNFEDTINRAEFSDVDRLFKIDLASKYKNIDFILETIKSGDSLYISKALKCEWITDDEYRHLINPEYLEQNIFPFLSLKMKNKLLATLSLRLRNAELAEMFHHYCMNNKMRSHGMNFLLYTNESFKVEILTLHPHVYNDFERTPEYLENFIGNSFILADYYLKVVCEQVRPRVLYKLRYLYAISQNQYLDMLEKYHCRSGFWPYSKKFSMSVMKKHKGRVLSDPFLYLSLLEKDIVVRYSTSDDAKVYAVPFLPEKEREYWYQRYYDHNLYFLSLIPLGERFTFIKKIFCDKYNSSIFEDDLNFYVHKCYKMMTRPEKEDWALKQLALGEEVHGSGNDYIWYRFINFQKAFEDLKKYILIATENAKRSKIIETLVESANTQEDLLILLNYYYNRHVNEIQKYKRSFLFKVINTHEVLKFNDACWSALEKLFFSLDVYRNLQDPRKSNDTEFRVLSLKYYLIHDKPVPDVFYEYVVKRCCNPYLMQDGFDKNKDAEKLDKIFLYMLSCYTTHVDWLMKQNNEKSREEFDKYAGYFLNFVHDFNKTFEDMPSLVKDYVMLHFDKFRSHVIFSHLLEPAPEPEFRESDIIHYLKKDAYLYVKDFIKIKKYFQTTNRNKRNINWLIRKLKIYFYHDMAPQYISLLNECLSTEELYLQSARVAIFGIFNLSDEEYKISFLQKYAPTDIKVDHANISRNLLTIQTAICSVACESRPPLPLSVFRQYIQGDYLQYCLPIFNSYLATLTPNQCMIFVESLLNSPVSVQKHALRLAFHCFSIGTLKSLVLKVWDKMKNVSLRKVLYTSMFHKVNFYHDKLDDQQELFEILTTMTNTLHQDDDEEIFELLASLLPNPVFAKHFENGYKVVVKFPPRVINFERTVRILETLISHCREASLDFLHEIIEDHITTTLDQNLLLDQEIKEGYDSVIQIKWELTQTVIIKRDDMYILDIILDKCISNWRKTHGNDYIYRNFLMDFFTKLEHLSFKEYEERLLETNSIFKYIVQKVEKAVPAVEIYVSIWKLKTNILVREVLGELNPGPSDNSYETLTTFSSRMKDVVKEYVEQGMFFKSLCNEITDVFNDAIRRICDKFVSSKEPDNARICLGLALSEINNRNIDIFLIGFIPNSYEGPHIHEYCSVINKLKALEDKEIKYLMCHKFYSCDYMVRDFYAM